MDALLGFFTNHIGPLPVWAWVAVVGGGVVLAVVLKNRFGNQSTTATDGGSTGTGTSNSALDPNIDPNTGVPYSVEEATNPNTGLPAYYGGAGITTSNAPQGQSDLSQVLAALNQIQASTNTQQNPSGAGGVAAIQTQATTPAVVDTSSQNHPPALSGSGGSTPNTGDTSGGTGQTYTPPPQPQPTPVPSYSANAYRLAGSTTIITNNPENTGGGRTPTPTAVRGRNRYQ